MQTRLKETVERDALGNPLDPDVKYARGRVLRGGEDEAKRQQHGLDLISRKISEGGTDALFNLLGVVRDQPILPEDLPNLGFLRSIVNLRGKAERAALGFLGGDPTQHMGFVTNRVSAASVVAMLAMVKPGETVLCASPDGRTHPSVKLGVKLARGSFIECVGFKDVEDHFSSKKKISTVVVTTITPQLRHLPFDEVKRIVAFARSAGLHTYIDDAHGAVRMVAYNEPGPMTLDPDATAISSDKHIYGPRAGVMAGRTQMMERIRAISLELGVEAQTPTLAAVHRALTNHSTDHIQRALKVAGELKKKLEQSYPKWFYFANDCAALNDENVVKMLSKAAGRNLTLVPQEVCSALSMLMLEKFGMITVSTVAAPGAAPYLRLVAWPDGHRLSSERIVQALDYAVAKLSPISNDETAVRKIIMGA